MREKTRHSVDDVNKLLTRLIGQTNTFQNTQPGPPGLPCFPPTRPQSSPQIISLGGPFPGGPARPYLKLQSPVEAMGVLPGPFYRVSRFLSYWVERNRTIWGQLSLFVYFRAGPSCQITLPTKDGLSSPSRSSSIFARLPQQARLPNAVYGDCWCIGSPVGGCQELEGVRSGLN